MGLASSLGGATGTTQAQSPASEAARTLGRWTPKPTESLWHKAGSRACPETSLFGLEIRTAPREAYLAWIPVISGARCHGCRDSW